MGIGRKIKGALAGAFLAAAPPATACDIALALAVDISGSVDNEEYRIQMDGLVAALTDSTVTEALVRGRAAVSVIQWTSTSRQDVVVPWVRIETADDIERIAEAVEGARRRWVSYATAIGDALDFISGTFDEVADCRRKVIDLSGDGISNEGRKPAELRSELYRRGFTVNALAIETAGLDLTAYYWENVIVGELAFVMTAEDYSDYPDKIRRKLLREVTEQLSYLERTGEKRTRHPG